MAAFSGLGINFAHDGTEYNDPTECGVRLDYLLSVGIKKIRVLLPAYTTEAQNTAFRDKLRAVCVAALDKGFYVIWGYTVNGVSNLTNTTMTGAYHDALTGMATWAQSLSNSDRFELQLGNEDDGRVDGSTVTTAQYQAYVRGTLCTDVQAIFTKGKVSYSTHTGYWANWQSGGLGSLNRFGMNIYGSTSLFDSYISTFTALDHQKYYFTEWNASDNGTDDFATTQAFDAEINRRMTSFINARLDSYFFGYSIDPAKWTMRLGDGTYRSAWYILTGRLREFNNNPFLTTQVNICNNPSFNTGTGQWTGEQSASISRTATGGVDGGAYGSVTSTTNGTSDVYTNPNLTGSAAYIGKRCVVSFYAKAATPPSGNNATVGMAQVSGGSGSVNFAPTTSWVRYSFSFIVTTSQNFIMKLWGKQQFTGNSGTVDYDQILVEMIPQGISSLNYPSTYFDGTTANCSWTGTANASTSTRNTQQARFFTTRSASGTRQSATRTAV